MTARKAGAGRQATGTPGGRRYPAGRSLRCVIHPLALCDATVGEGSRVWAWAHVMDGAQVGADCNIGEHAFIEGGAVIGDRCTIKNGVSVWEGVTLHDEVFVGPHAVFTNDLRPRSRQPAEVVPTVVQRGATIGANATIVCGITVGAYAFVAAGAVVTKDVPPYTEVRGVPARVVGRVCRCNQPGDGCPNCG
jgi:UDP-2-acetamido-3-amino-2,3-dideoxy-glucuronate N-acetyltransferase